MAATNKAGFSQDFDPETVWLLNREAIADRYHCTPVEVEGWPAYEQAVALKMLQIRSEAEKRKQKK